MPLDPGSVADTKLYYGVRSAICSGTFNDAHYFVCLKIRGKEEIPCKWTSFKDYYCLRWQLNSAQFQGQQFFKQISKTIFFLFLRKFSFKIAEEILKKFEKTANKKRQQQNKTKQDKMKQKSDLTIHGFSLTHTLLFLFSYIFTRYSFDLQIANANRGGSILFSKPTLFNYTGNKTEMKKYNIKRQKDTQQKKKRKWEMLIVKEKKSESF